MGGMIKMFCTECGDLMHPEDARNHICDEAKKPKKGMKKEWGKL